MKQWFLATLICAMMVACRAPEGDLRHAPSPAEAPVEDSRQLRALKAMGFTEITLGSADISACSDDDSYFNSASFLARSPFTGMSVKGNVCCGFLKGCTVRTD